MTSIAFLHIRFISDLIHDSGAERTKEKRVWVCFLKALQSTTEETEQTSINRESRQEQMLDHSVSPEDTT
jgi:hypothetical protein